MTVVFQPFVKSEACPISKPLSSVSERAANVQRQFRMAPPCMLPVSPETSAPSPTNVTSVQLLLPDPQALNRYLPGTWTVLVDALGNATEAWLLLGKPVQLSA